MALVALAALVASGPAAAQGFRVDVGQSGASRTLTVAGDAVVQAPPDRAIVSFGIETPGQTAEETLRRHEEQVERVLTAVRRFGIADRQIRIEYLALNERYVEEGRRDGLVAVRQVSVTLDDLRRVPDLVATVVSEGANRLNGLVYTLRDADPFEDQALEAAFARAREKAERLARASGASLGEVVAVQEQGVFPPVPYPMPLMRQSAAMADGAAAGVPGAYSAGEQEVRAAVVVTYELED